MREGCAPFEHELSAYLDGEISAAERVAFDAHLHACARCRTELRELRRVGETLRRWDAQETRYATSTGFRNRVMASLGAGDSAVPADDARTWRRAAVAAAVAAGAVGAFTWAASRPATPAGTDLAAMEARVQELERGLDRVRRAAPQTASDAAPRAPRAPLAVERLGELPPIVGDATPPDAADRDAAQDDPWEMRGDGMLLRDALDDYDQFVKERGRLVIEERLARVEQKGTAAGAPTAAAPPPTAFASFLAQVQVSPAPARPFDRVQIWPVEAASTARAPRILLLEQAIDERVLSVVEDASGTVVAENSDLKDRPVLLLTGDVLRGGQRDRVVSEDVLLAPGRRTSLPVFGASDVRARTIDPRFKRSRLMAPSDLRAFLATTWIGADVTQSDVSSVVDASLTVLGSLGGERSLENLYTNPELQREVSRYVSEFRKRLDRPSVVGFAVAIGSDLIGVELCGDPETFRALRDRLVRSHVLYALSRPGEATQGGPPSDLAVRTLVSDAAKAVFDEPPATGDGTLGVFRSADGRTFGCGLLEGSRLLHATLYAGVPPGGAADVARGHGVRATPATALPDPRNPGAAPGRPTESPLGTGVNGR